MLSRAERKSLLRSWHLGKMAWGRWDQIPGRKADTCREALHAMVTAGAEVLGQGGPGREEEGPVIKEKDFIQLLSSDRKSRRLWADDLMGLTSSGGYSDYCFACRPGYGNCFSVRDQLINILGSVGPGVVSTLLSCAPETQRLPWTACHVSA